MVFFLKQRNNLNNTKCKWQNRIPSIKDGMDKKSITEKETIRQKEPSQTIHVCNLRYNKRFNQLTAIIDNFKASNGSLKSNSHPFV